MEEMIFEWRDRTIVTSKTKATEVELVNLNNSNSSLRCFMATSFNGNTVTEELNIHED